MMLFFVIWLRFQDTLNLSKVTQADYSEWIIAMSHEVTQKVSLVWDSESLPYLKEIQIWWALN